MQHDVKKKKSCQCWVESRADKNSIEVKQFPVEGFTTEILLKCQTRTPLQQKILIIT